MKCCSFFFSAVLCLALSGGDKADIQVHGKFGGVVQVYETEIHIENKFVQAKTCYKDTELDGAYLAIREMPLSDVGGQEV